MQGYQMAKVIGTAGIAALLDHDVQPAGGQRRKLFQGLAEKGQVGVETGGAAWHTEPRQAGLGQHTGHRAVMHAQLGGNGADAPVLGMVYRERSQLNLLEGLEIQAQ